MNELEKELDARTVRRVSRKFISPAARVKEFDSYMNIQALNKRRRRAGNTRRPRCGKMKTRVCETIHRSASI
jgi:hypothetical protein